MDRPPQPQQQQQCKAIVCDFGALTGKHIDVALIDALARLQLVLRQYGLELLLRDAPVELLELLGLTGLEDVLRVEPHGQAE